jgi:hypothetical protein
MSLALLVLPALLLASETEEESPLLGLTELELVIAALEPELEKGGLAPEQIRTDVEQKLRMAGIEVLDRDDTLPDKELTATLYVNLHTIKGGRYGFSYIYHVYVECVREAFSKEAPPIEPLAPMWSRSLLDATNDVEEIRKGIIGVVDMFLDDYFSVNPK